MFGVLALACVVCVIPGEEPLAAASAPADAEDTSGSADKPGSDEQPGSDDTPGLDDGPPATPSDPLDPDPAHPVDETLWPRPDRVRALADLLASAQQNQVDLRLAELRAERAALLSKKAWSQFLPRIGFRFGAKFADHRVWVPLGKPGREDDVKLQDHVQWQMTSGFRWHLLDGPASVGVQLANVIADLQTANHALARANLEQRVTRAALSLLALQRQRENALLALRTGARLHAKIKRCSEEQESVGADLLRSEAALMARQYQMEKAERARRLGVIALANLIGERPDGAPTADFWVAPSPATNQALPADFAETLAAADSQRLDLKQRQLELTVALRQRAKTIGHFFPRLVATGAYDWTDLPGFHPELTRFVLGVSIEWDIVSAGTHYWRLQEQAREVKMRELAMARTRTELEWQIAAALIDHGAVSAMARTSSRWVDLAARAAAATRTQAALCGDNYNDSVQTEEELFAARTAHNLAQLALDLSTQTLATVTVAPAGSP